MNIRVFAAFFPFVVAFITTVLVPVAYFGDKNEIATKRLIVVAFVAAVIFMVAVFW